MLATLLRVLIIYVAVILAVRLMGKRQVGEMQPTELVITILLSEIAAQPVSDGSKLMLPYLSGVFLLAALEIANSFAALCSNRYRIILQGRPVIVIRDGAVDQKQLKKLRVTVEDLTAALRDRGFFDITQISYAVMETNGKISALAKAEENPLTPGDIKLPCKDKGMPITVIYDGRIIRKNFGECSMTEKKLNVLLKKHKLSPEQILLMTVNMQGEENIILRDKAR
ncbi:MAG: DUF421 domain-containing protein [Clostridiales bacterium]|nr:DUF421 domain-containing protein [Clostridiales bacterium]